MRIKKSLKYILGAIIISWATFSLSSFKNEELIPVTINSILQYLNYWSKIPKEKLYLHIDKPYYSAGEKIWFKGYLVNGSTYKKDTLSNFIYVELFSKQDSLIARKKIKRENGDFFGCISLPNTLIKGDYYLRSYTTWMQNFDNDYFFYRNIYIANPLADKLTSTINFFTNKGELISARIDLFMDKKALPDKVIEYELVVDGKSISKKKATTNLSGNIGFSLKKIPANFKKAFVSINLVDNTYEYHNLFAVPQVSTDFGASFFPEGGALLQSTIQKVAFKVEKSNGMPVSATGYLINNTQDTLSQFKTIHEGMGVFLIQPELEKSYTAVITTKDGITKTFNLPEVKTLGINISIEYRKNFMYYKFIHTPHFALNDSLYFIIQSNNTLLSCKLIENNDQKGIIDSNTLPEGIVHFILVAGHGKTPLSERLAFVQHPFYQKWKIKADKPEYNSREKAEIDLKLTDSEGTPYSGDFSVSITDRFLVEQDSMAGNIRSSLLLTSDLKGYIHNPGYYFSGESNLHSHELDLLMMTQGWRKYTNYDFENFTPFNLKYYIERGQTLSGKVVNFFGRDLKESQIVACDPKNNVFKAGKTDDKGIYVVDGLDFKDTVDFIIQARSKKGHNSVELMPDIPVFPEGYNKNFYIPHTQKMLNENFLETARYKYFIEGGTHIHYLKEIVVTADKIEKDSNKSMYASAFNESVKADDYVKSGAQNAFDIVQRMGGVMATNSSISIRGNGQPLFLLDDTPFETSDLVSTLKNITIDDLDYVTVMKDALCSFFGSRGANGVIIVTTKRGYIPAAKESLNVLHLKVLGYSTSPEFYHPIYATQLQRDSIKNDIRNTLYWNHSIRLDSKGETKIIFYTADKSSRLHINIEGVADNGIVCRCSKDL